MISALLLTCWQAHSVQTVNALWTSKWRQCCSCVLHLFRAAGEKGPGQRAYVGLPSAPAPEPSRRAQMISIPAAANTSVMTNAKWAQRRQNPKCAAAAEAS